MEKETTPAEFRDDFWNCFDHSYGCLCDGSIYYWENRWGGKTFIKASANGVIEFGIVYSNFSRVAVHPFADAETLNIEWEYDNRPNFHSPTNKDLVELVSILIRSFISTDFFIEKYLTPGKVLSKNESERFDDFFYGRREVPESAKDYAKKMGYQDFLRTPYWMEIAKRVKNARGARCQLCGAKDHLELHHSEYSIRGDELGNLDKLTVLCRDCHAKFHDKVK